MLRARRRICLVGAAAGGYGGQRAAPREDDLLPPQCHHCARAPASSLDDPLLLFLPPSWWWCPWRASGGGVAAGKRRRVRTLAGLGEEIGRGVTKEGTRWRRSRTSARRRSRTSAAARLYVGGDGGDRGERPPCRMIVVFLLDLKIPELLLDAGHGHAPLLAARNAATPYLAQGFHGGGGGVPQVGGLGSRQRQQMGAEGNQMAAEEEALGFRGGGVSSRGSIGVVFRVGWFFLVRAWGWGGEGDEKKPVKKIRTKVGGRKNPWMPAYQLLH